MSGAGGAAGAGGAGLAGVVYVCLDPGVPAFGRKGCSVHVQEVLRCLVARTSPGAVHLVVARTGGAAPAGLEDVVVHELGRPSAPDDAARERALERLDVAAAELVAGLVADLSAAGVPTGAPTGAAGDVPGAGAGEVLVHQRYGLWSARVLERAREVGALTVLEVNAPLVEEQAAHRVLVDRAAAEATTVRALRAAHLAVAVSGPVAQWARELSGVDVAVLPNGVDPARFDPERSRPRGGGAPSGARSEAPDGAEDGVFTVGFVGTFRPWHGAELLVRAAAEVAGELRRGTPVGPLTCGDAGAGGGAVAGSTGDLAAGTAATTGSAGDDVSATRAVDDPGGTTEGGGVGAGDGVRPQRLRLLLVGDGPTLPGVLELAAATGLEVVSTGAVDPADVPALLAGCDAAAAPYPAGPAYFSPLKVVEYLAAGLPVVAAAVADVPHLLRDEHEVLLVAPGDGAALRDALRRLVHDPALRGRLAAGGRRAVLERLTWDGVVDRALSLARDRRRAALGASARTAGPDPAMPVASGRVEVSALRRTIGVLRPHLGGSRLLAVGGLGAVLLEVAMRLLEPWPVKWVVDAVVPVAAGGPAPEGVGRLLLGAAVAVLVVAGLRAAASYLSTVAFALIGARVTVKLRAQLYERLLGAPLGFHAGARSGDLVTRVVGDVGRVQEVAVTAGLPLLANVVTVLGMIVVVAVLDPVLAVVVLVVLPLLLLSGRRAATRITGASRDQRRSEGHLAGDAGESFAAVRMVQAYGLVGHLGERFTSTNRRGLRDGVRSRRLAAGLERRTDLVVGAATGVVLLVGGHRVLAGAITPGELVVFLTYLKTTFKPLRDLAKQTGRIARAAASGERVADALDRAGEVLPERSWARPLPRRRRATRSGGAGGTGGSGGVVVELDGVTAGHPGRPAVLRGADLVVRPGEVVAVVGPSGSGKSTLLQLLLRLVDPASGVLRIDGHDVVDLTRDSVRAATAVVLQESAVLAGTLADNVRLGRLDATDAEVVTALHDAGLAALLRDSPLGIDTPVAERGATLSGGQRQRLAIARALLRDPALVLLDEPTTGLDAVSAGEVMASLERLAAGRTTLLVTHDAGLLGRADRVVDLVDGRFVERGGRAGGASGTTVTAGTAGTAISTGSAGGGGGAGTAGGARSTTTTTGHDVPDAGEWI